MTEKMKPGVKPKLSDLQQIEVINSKLPVKELALQYNVSINTIYIILNRRKKIAA